MATSDAIHSFDGTPTTVISGTSTLADENFSTSSTATETELDFSASTDLWIAAKAVLSCSFSTAPDDQAPIELWYFEQDIDGTNDMTGPTGSSEEGARYLGSFKVRDGVTTQQYDAIPISLWGVKKAKFSIRNKGGQTMDSDFTVKIEGFTAVPRS